MFPAPRLAHALALALCLPSLAPAQQSASFPSDDPGIVYSDYACAHLSPERASFDRELAADWLCGQERMSPGVRATFLVDASQVSFELEYAFAGFFCGFGELLPLSWEFGLVVDGVRRPTGARNPLYPLVNGSTPWIHLGSGTGTHLVTLIWPSGADVDLTGIHLRETRDDSLPELLAAPPRTERQLTIFGDSISHGLDATHVLNTYAARLGMLKGWRIVNLGYSGRTTQPTDAWLAAGITPCPDGLAPPPDLLLLEIGSNDFHIFNNIHTRLDKFEQRYRDWLAQFRLLRPSTPILCLTALPRGDECSIKKRALEDYRATIRRLVEERTDPDIYLLEGRDLIALPPVAGSPLYDAMLLHPSDAGIDRIIEGLASFNLVRNPGFELRPLAGCSEVPEPEPYLWTDLGTGTSLVTSSNTGSRALSLSAGAARSQVVHGLSAEDRYSLQVSGAVSASGQVGRVTLEFLDATDVPVGDALVLSFNQTSWRRVTRQGTAPAGAIRGRLTLSKGPGSGRFLVDDLELTLPDL